MKVLYVTSEASPFVKTGGLGDVAGALPTALRRRNTSVRVILPLYGSVGEDVRARMRFVKYIYVPLAWRSMYCGIFELKEGNITYYFVDNEYYFKRGDIYGYFDDCERFAFFSRAVTALLFEFDGWTPDVVHCNDWQTALVPIYLRSIYAGIKEYDDVRTVFTIHNIEYQGRYGVEVLANVCGLPSYLYENGTLEFHKDINLMKGAIVFADKVTTVSPTYASELQYGFYAHGLEGVLSHHRGKLSGILNGIDTDIFNPATDPALVAPYSTKNLKGKAVCKAELQKFLGLAPNPDTPLIVMVTRLADHKGLELIPAIFDQIMGLDVQIAVLGKGDWRHEHFLTEAARRYEGRLSANILYNASLAQQLYAGGDMFLMPSKAEPCGLSQMIAMRYGTVPIVRATGGLRDTVAPYNPIENTGLGFVFDNYDSGDLFGGIHRAVKLYKEDKKAWKDMVLRDLATDFSWIDSAKAYDKLYKDLSK